MKYFIYCALSLVMLSSTSCKEKRKAKNYNQETNVGQDGINFIVKALEGSATEIKVANFALTRAANPRVKAFAQMMITDHTRAAYELKGIASNKRVTTIDVISPEHEKMITDLSVNKKAKFDKAYMQMMLADHKETITLFKGATHYNSSKLKRFAEETLPILQMHLDSAVAINNSLK